MTWRPLRWGLWLTAAVLLTSSLGSAPPGPPSTSPFLLVIRGTYLGPNGAGLGGLADDAYRAVVEALSQAGLPYRGTTDDAVAQGREDLTKAAVIVLPYNRALSPAEVNLIGAAMDRGVALVVFHVAGERLESRLGVKTGEYTKPAEDERLLLRADVANLPGVPPTLTLRPYFTRSWTPLDDEVATAAWWQPPGEGDPIPAISVNSRGAFLGFVPCSEDAAALSPLLWALLGRLAPQVVSASLPRNARELGPAGPYPSLADLLQEWRTSGQGAEPEAWLYAKQAEDLLRQIPDLMAQGKTPQALALAAQARDLAAKAYWANFPSPAPEIRGVWTYPQGLPDWDRNLARLAQAHFNVVFPYVATAGVAYYPSAVLPRPSEAKGDCLAEACAASAKHGVEVHPRLVALQCLFTPPSVKQALAAQGRLMVDSRGKALDWLCPTDPRNQEQLLALATEIVLRYPVPGLQLDYFRYETTDSCLCARCRQQFVRDTGVTVRQWPADVVKGPLRERFLEWRREVLTGLLRSLRTQLRALRPDLKLSVAVFPNWQTAPQERGQDPVTWARAGLVDFLCPMTYTRDVGRFSSLTEQQMAQLGGAVPLAAGIGAFADGLVFDGPQDLADQIQAARRQGTGGFVIYNYNARFASDFLPWLELGLTRREARPVWHK